MRQASTEAERRLWRELRSSRVGGYKFRRQHPLGPFILDFFCFEAMLAVELDGGQHCAPEGAKSGRRRDAWLAEQGVRVLRFWNNDVLRETEAVLEAIWEGLDPHPDPLPEGEGAPARAAHDDSADDLQE